MVSMKKSLSEKPVIYITMGDPAGVGPEIIAKWFKYESADLDLRTVVVGDLPLLQRVFKQRGVERDAVLFVPGGDFNTNTVNVLHVESLGAQEVSWGVVNDFCGLASYRYIKRAVEEIRDGGGVLVTAPIHKESLRAGGIPYIGHTEILAGLSEDLGMTKDKIVPMTMFQTGDLRIFFLSRHLSLLEACRYVTRDNLNSFLPECCRYLKMISPSNPTLCVAGLNPHCGEHGLFGEEEVNEIIPAIKSLQKEGLSIIGPLGADSVFHQAAIGRYGAVASLYHDQGHIAAKTLDFYGTVSVTLGLPFLRTSVDHGTAFDIAGEGIADHRGLSEAIKTAVEYAGFYL